MTICPTDVSEYTSQVYAGLFDLHERGEIATRIRQLRVPAVRVPHSVFLELKRRGELRPRRVFIDLIDGGRILQTALEHVDVYVKRSLRFLPEPPGPAGTLILPYGLQFSARTPSMTARTRSVLHLRASFRGGIAYSPTLRLQAAFSVAGRYLRSGAHAVQGGAHLLSTIENNQAHKDAAVFFATRVYAAEEAPGTPELESINEKRAALVRALKAAFGPRFVGGLRPSSTAMSRYPDCVYRVENNHAWHYRAGRTSLIHVNSTGLHGSTGWKFAEALAQQSCLVTEPSRDVLPEPFVDGVHGRHYDSVDECVSICEQLLTDLPAADVLRNAGHAYYLDGVQPVALMRSILTRALDQVDPHAA